MQVMKKCTHCGKKKPKEVRYFRKTKKTLDKFYPFCKECAYKNMLMTKCSPEKLAKDLFIDILEQAFEEPVGTKLYFNKTMFLEFMLSYPEFQKLYKKWLKYDYNTMKLCVKLIKTLPQGTYSLDNLELFIRPLYDNENLDILRTAPTRPVRS